MPPTLIPMNATPGSWNAVLDAVTKSPSRVPIAITRSASRASRFAASPPAAPIGPAFIGWFHGRAPLPAWLSATGMPNRVANRSSACVASA